MKSAASLREALLADLALVNAIPLYKLDDEPEFTLDQHLAFQRLTDAIPDLLDTLSRINQEARREGQQSEPTRLIEVLSEEWM